MTGGNHEGRRKNDERNPKLEYRTRGENGAGRHSDLGVAVHGEVFLAGPCWFRFFALGFSGGRARFEQSSGGCSRKCDGPGEQGDYYVDRGSGQALANSLGTGLVMARCSCAGHRGRRSEEHTSELQSRGLISYAVFCLKK